jgi:hypothetical protein
MDCVRFVGGCAVLMMRDGFVFAQFVFLIQSFGRSPATTQAEAAARTAPPCSCEEAINTSPM